MAATEVRQSFQNLLLERVRVTEYPSRELMDRIEATLRDTAEAVEYIDVLMEKVQTYPSLQLLDRIHRVVIAVEASEARADRERDSEADSERS
jgi:hypothetical protein